MKAQPSKPTASQIMAAKKAQKRDQKIERVAKAIDLSPAQICAIEFGRAELTDAQAVLIADFICGISRAERVAIERQRLENIANLQNIARQHD